ncbi:MAG: DUF1540 domain-containing protein [Fibrobacter sp.]|nr:DUF1540 domain-containing protein [Fibrobacter sp.]
MSRIIDCEAINCVYNKGKKCHTLAITVGDELEASCDTFFPAENKGGFTDINGGVGACKISNCEYNDAFECTASGIHVITHANHADCGTYQPKKT